MVRKTKEDAEITRQRIINAAREVFLTKGVSKTSLEQIASHANVTRGAVYWHFDNKAALFHAMRKQVVLPLIDQLDDTLLSKTTNTPLLNDALTRIEYALQSIIDMLDASLETRQTYIIMMSKCEYVDEFATVLQEILNNCADVVHKLEQAYLEAKNQHLIDSSLSANDLAMDTHLFFSGLLHMWVKDDEGTKFRHQAKALISAHMQMRRKK